MAEGGDDMHYLSVLVFLVLISGTLILTALAARRVKTDRDFYAAGGQIPGWQNGLAIAGEFMASGAFLGIAGLIAFHGLDGEIFSICWFASFFVVLVLVAEVIRNSGKYTFVDIVSYRLDANKIRPAVAITVFVVSLAYLIPQMVAAGALSRILFGISDTMGILIVGGLMIVYVSLGGMMAATWIQSIKAVFLLAGGYILAALTMSHFDFSVPQLFAAVAESPELGEQWIQQGGWLSNPIERYSLGLSLLFGTAAMPHVLMRMFTVKTKQQAQKSALWTMVFMGMFHMITFIFGLGAAVLVGRQSIAAMDPGGNLATPMLAQFVAGGAGTFTGELFMAFIVSVAFITVIATVSGLCIAASTAFSYDFWFKVVKKGHQEHDEQVRTARIAAIAIGILSILVSLLLKNVNVAYLSGLAFSIAATVNLPAIILALYWRKLTTQGAMAGILSGMALSLFAVLGGPSFMGKAAIFPLANPGIVTIPLGFLITWAVSCLTADERAKVKYEELSVRAHSGLGAE